MMAATVFKSPELMLEKTEADALAGAISEVEKFYSVSLSPEARAWAGLAATAAMIYGPRAYLIAKRRKSDRGPKPAPQSAPAPLASPETAPTDEGAPKPSGPITAADFGL